MHGKRLKFTTFDADLLEPKRSYNLTDKGIVSNATVILSPAGRVFFAGGSWIEEGREEFYRDFREMKIRNKVCDLEELGDMKEGADRMGYACMAFDSDPKREHIILVGGRRQGISYAGSAAFFDTRNEDWVDMVPLTHARKSPAVCCFGKNYVYVFGGKGEDYTGQKDQIYVTKIERCRINKRNASEWEMLDIELRSDLIRSSLVAVATSNDSILLIGGRGKLENGKNEKQVVNFIPNLMQAGAYQERGIVEIPARFSI